MSDQWHGDVAKKICIDCYIFLLDCILIHLFVSYYFQNASFLIYDNDGQWMSWNAMRFIHSKSKPEQFLSSQVLGEIQTNMKWRYRIQIWAWSVFDSTTNQSWKLIIRTSDIELPIPTTLNIEQLIWIRKVKSKRFATKHQLRINPRQQGAPKTYEPKFARGNHSHIDQ